MSVIHISISTVSDMANKPQPAPVAAVTMIGKASVSGSGAFTPPSQTTPAKQPVGEGLRSVLYQYKPSVCSVKLIEHSINCGFELLLHYFIESFFRPHSSSAA